MGDGIDDVREIMGKGEDVDLPDELRPEDDGALPHEDDATAPPEAIDPDLIRRAATCPLNDFGNGERFALYYGDDVIWVPRVGWFVWNGRFWKSDPDSIEVRRRAQQIAARIESEVPFLVLSDRQMELLARETSLWEARKAEEAKTDDDGALSAEARDAIAAIDRDLNLLGPLKRRLTDLRKAHRSFARTAGNSSRITALLVETGIGLARPLDALDAGPLDVNTQNGVLRFTVTEGAEDGMSRTAAVEFLPHARDQLLTKAVGCLYDPEARCPGFDRFLARVQPAGEMRRFLQRWFGLSMTGLTGEQKMAFFFGMGANGKSVMVDLIAKILGAYAATAKIESLIGKNRRSGGDATPDLIPLVGARFVRASEPEEGERWQEAKLKELTGGEPILARGLNADFFEFQPIFKLTVSGNHKPDIRGTDDGIWRRMMLVPWDVQIPAAERIDKDRLIGQLHAEAPGILNWMVEGLLDYLENGLQEPDKVLEATQEYREESDPLGTMLAECTVVGGEEFISARDLIDAFKFWQEDRGETPWGNRTVSNKLREKAGRWRHPNGKGFIAGKSGVTGYRGIVLTDTFKRRIEDVRQAGGARGAREDWGA